MSNDLTAKLDKLRGLAAQESKTPETTSAEPAKRRTRKLFNDAATEQDNALKTEIQVENTKIFKILVDSNLENEEQVEKIEEMLLFDFAEEDNQSRQEALTEVRAIIKALIEDFTAQNKDSIELAQNNPLSELTENIREVFENYNELCKGRSDLKDKLKIVQGYIEQSGGEDQLIKSLAEAQDKKVEKDRLETDKTEAESKLSSAEDVLKAARSTEIYHARELQELEQAGFFAKTFSGEHKRSVEIHTKSLAEAKAEKSEAQATQAEAKETFESSDTALTSFLDSSNYHIYEEILSILDIGDADFKEALSNIATQTLKYIEDTETSMTGVRNQLEKLLTDVRGCLDVSVNTSDKISVLQQALSNAQGKNALGYEQFVEDSSKKEAIEGLEGLGEYETRKITESATAYMSEMKRSVNSTTQISGNVVTHQTTLAQLKTDLENGLSDAESQLVQAVSTSAATGQTMLQRTQRLASMAQAIVSRSMFSKEMDETLLNVADDFRSQIESQMARNNDIEGFAENIKQLTEALDTKNDATITLAGQQQDLVERLNVNIEKLKQSNADAEEIDSVIALNTAKQKAPAPAPAAG